MSAPKQAQRAYTAAEAAAIKSVSRDTIVRAIRSTEPPFLRAKKLPGRGGYRIDAVALEEWWDSLPDG